MRRVLLLFILIFGAIQGFASSGDLGKSKGTDQDMIVQLTPVPAQEKVSRYTKIEAVFNIPLDSTAIKKHDIKLTHLSSKTNDHIAGEISYDADSKTLTFTPVKRLEPGLYEVEFKSLKADKAHKKTKIKEFKYRFMVVQDTTAPVITLNGEVNLTLFQGGTYTELGASAIDNMDGDVTVTVNSSVDTSTEGTYTIRYSATDRSGNKAEATRTVNVVIPQLVSLILESNATSLNLGEKAVLIVTGNYEDNSTKELSSNIEWVMTPTDSVEIKGTTLTVLKDVNTALQAKVGSILSNILNLELYWEVNGHRLPPEPDPTVNNSTLLGIDSNDNGVRDDVERWIYETYKDKHPIHIDIAMQAGRAYKQVLETPERAKEIHDEVSASLDCELYYRRCKAGKELHFIDRNEKINSDYFRKQIYFNTKDRLDTYWQYDTLLSGDSYTIPWCSERKKFCDFNITKYEK